MKNKSNVSLSLRKVLLSALVAAPLATLPVPLWALPADQTALNGMITPSSGVSVTLTNANRIDVTSSATNSVIKWTDFGGGANAIGSGDLINYSLPSASSSILNMVTGTNSTVVNGHLTANGNLWILNPNGIGIGSTGVITANGVGLSTVPETEYNFLTNGTLTFVPNQSSTTTADIVVSPGATITAASGTGNVWITGNDVGLAGTIDGGNVTVSTQNNGIAVLGYGGSLTIGDTFTKASTLSVTTTGTGDIRIGDNLTPTASTVTTVIGNSVSLTTGNAAIATVNGGTLVVGAGGNASSTLTTNSGTADTTLTGVSNNNGNLLTVNATGANVSVTANAGKLAVGATASGTLTAVTSGTATDLTLNASQVNGAISVTTAGKLLSGGAVNGNSTVTLNGASGKDVTFQGRGTSYTVNGTLGNVSLTATGGNVTLGPITATNLSVTSPGFIAQSGTGVLTVTGGNVTLNAGTWLTISQSIVGNKLTVSAGGDILQNPFVPVVSGGASASFTSTGGNITLDQLGVGALTANASGNLTFANNAAVTGTLTATAGSNLAVNGALSAATLVATAGNITQTVSGTLTAGNATITANTAATLGSANDFTNLVLKGAGSQSITDANGVIIAGGTSSTGNISITATTGNIKIGNATADAISIGGNLALTTSAAAGTITEGSNNVTVNGNLNLTTAGGDISLVTANNAVGLNNSYGKIDLSTTGNASVYESSSLNLGNVTVGGLFTAYSATSILDSGLLNITGNVSVGAGTASAPGAIALDYDGATHNTFGGTITLLTDLQLLGSATIGNYLASGLTVVAGTTSASPLVYIPANVYGNGTSANVSLYGIGGAAIKAGALNTSGIVTLGTVTGSITATDAGNTFSTVNVVSGNTTGASAISTTKDLTVNTTSAPAGLTAYGNASVANIGGSQAITYTSSGNVTIGSYTSLSTGSTKFAAGSSKQVTDSNPGIFIYGDVTLTGGAVNIARGGHNFGKINITTSGNGTATIVEGGTLNINSVSTGVGAFSATSQNGDILENGAAGAISAGNVTLSAAGNVTLSGTTTGNNISGWVAATAGRDVTVNTVGNITLGNIAAAAGNLTVDASAASKNIGQASGTMINAYGTTTFKTDGAGKITLTNSGNQFGALTLTNVSGAGNISVTELGTMNLKSATTTGAFSATSETGDIIDSGALTLNTGAVSFTATTGNINLTKSSDFPSGGSVGVKLTAAGNASIKDAGDILLDTSSVGGALSVTSGGNIAQLGVLNVSGDATFSATNGITLTNTANTFGTVKFTSGAASILDSANTFTLRSGSFSTAAVTINTGGDFKTTGTGGSSFTGASLTINAPVGTIMPSAGSLLVTGTFTVYSNVAVDLSQLSKSGNLNNKDPLHPGSGTYSAPGL